MKRYLKIVLAFFGSGFFLFAVILICVSMSINMIAASFQKQKKQNEEALSDLPKMLTYEIISAAVENYEEYGVPTAITLAQIILESRGSYPLPDGSYSRLAWESKNLFGIKGQGDLGSDSYKTREEKDKNSYYIQSDFAKYSSFKASIKAHGRLLSSSFYKSKVKDKTSSNSWAYALQGTYATSSTYTKSLKDIMKQYNLYRFDNIKKHSLNALLSKDKFVGTKETFTEKQNRIIAAAKSFKNPYNNGYKGLCELWCYDVYKKAGLSYNGSCCAAENKRLYAGKIPGKIRPGALIYSGSNYKSGTRCEVCKKDAGHVAIYIGDGKVAGSNIPFIMDINKFISIFGYGGWSFSNNKIN